MKLYRQPSLWSCFPTALAMCIDVVPNDVIKVIGHDGSMVVWPWKHDPFNRRSFHPNEINLAAKHFGYAVTCFENFPRMMLSEDPDSVYFVEPPDLSKLLKTETGMLLGAAESGMPHAVAWSPVDQLVYDPNFTTYGINKFHVRDFYVVSKRN